MYYTHIHLVHVFDQTNFRKLYCERRFIIVHLNVSNKRWTIYWITVGIKPTILRSVSEIFVAKTKCTGFSVFGGYFQTCAPSFYGKTLIQPHCLLLSFRSSTDHANSNPAACGLSSSSSTPSFIHFAFSSLLLYTDNYTVSRPTVSLYTRLLTKLISSIASSSQL